MISRTQLNSSIDTQNNKPKFNIDRKPRLPERECTVKPGDAREDVVAVGTLDGVWMRGASREYWWWYYERSAMDASGLVDEW